MISDFGSANLARVAKTMVEGAIIYAEPETIHKHMILTQLLHFRPQREMYTAT